MALKPTRALAAVAIFSCSIFCLHSGFAAAAAEYKIVTASDKGTYYAIGKDLAKLVAPDADIQLEVLPTSGSAANVKLLRYEPGVKFAIVQADVYQAFIDRAGAGNTEASSIIKPLRVILPLYNTEIARAAIFNHTSFRDSSAPAAFSKRRHFLADATNA